MIDVQIISRKSHEFAQEACYKWLGELLEPERIYGPLLLVCNVDSNMVPCENCRWFDKLENKTVYGSYEMVFKFVHYL